jgi:hypothetical protein
LSTPLDQYVDFLLVKSNDVANDDQFFCVWVGQAAFEILLATTFSTHKVNRNLHEIRALGDGTWSSVINGLPAHVG